MTRWLLVVVVVVLGAAGYFYLVDSSSAPDQNYRTAKVDRGSLSVSITATGALQAVTTVQVGTQVSGVVSRLFVDFNDQVKAGQVVAQLDTDLLEVRLAQDRAALVRSESNLAKLEVDQADALRNLERQKELFEKKIASQIDLDAAQYRFETAQAQLRIAQAELKQAKSAVSASEINLRHATITSPIDGVVISRSVDVGQTVAASLSAPTLFTIANDLSKMWVLANIDEADIGKITHGQVCTFTVDSFPDKEFQGKVRQVRLQPQTVQNVVMYTVVIDVDNPGGVLLPGMTANLSVLVDHAGDVLRVPNAALRFQSGAESAMGPTSMSARGSDRSNAGKDRPANGHGSNTMQAAREAIPGKPGRVHLLVEGKLNPVEIRTGRSDGAFTEVLSGEIKPGDEVVIGGGIVPASPAMQGQPGRSPWGRR